MGAVNQVGDGKQTKFWTDVRLGEVPLKIRYHKLYEIYFDPDCTVDEVVEMGNG
jgi:hypothetical protein